MLSLRLTSGVFIAIICLQSCVKTVFPTHANVINMHDPSELVGEYKNISADTSEANNDLWTVLTKKPGPQGYKPMINAQVSKIIIRRSTSRKLFIELHNDSTLIRKTALVGKMDGNAFRIRERTHYFGLPFVFMTLSHYQFQLSKDDAGRLLIDVADAHGGMVFIFSGGNTNFYFFKYHKK